MQTSNRTSRLIAAPGILILAGLLAFWIAMAVTTPASAAGPAIAPTAWECTSDSDGANDEPGQKDLTLWCNETAPAAGTRQITWNWDVIAMSGNNTADGCALFDTDSDGLVNYAVCESWGKDPPAATDGYPIVYSCKDTRPFNCADATPVTNTGTTCTLAVTADDPFAEGDAFPNDAKASCTISLADVGGSSATLLDVCSYPSASPTSDFSDCVAISGVSANLNVLKDVYPDDPATNWTMSISGPTPFSDSFSGDGSTGIQVVTAGQYDIQEAAGLGTSLDGYVSSWSCNLNGDPVSSGSGTSITGVTAEAGKVLNCTFTNKRPLISVKKYTSDDNSAFYDADTCTQWQDPAAPDYCPQINEGAPVYWKYVITNDGQVDLTNIALTDDQLPGAVFSCSPVALGGALPVGESTTCTTTGSAVFKGLIKNIGTASGTATGTNGNPLVVSDEDASHYYGAGPNSVRLLSFSSAGAANAWPAAGLALVCVGAVLIFGKTRANRRS